MPKKIFAVIMFCAFLLSTLSGPAFTAETKWAGTPQAPAIKKPAAIPAAPTPPAMPKAPRTIFRMLSGTIVKVDADKLELKSDINGSVHTVALTPKTAITKVTDAKDLKAGDKARLVVRSMDNKEVAVNVTYGNIQTVPTPRAVAPGSQNLKKPAAPPAPAAAKK